MTCQDRRARFCVITHLQGHSGARLIIKKSYRVVIPDMLANKTKRFQILVPLSPGAFNGMIWPGCTMYSANRAGLLGLLRGISDAHRIISAVTFIFPRVYSNLACHALVGLRQDLAGTNVNVVPIVSAESDTGYWEANPGSRQ